MTDQTICLRRVLFSRNPFMLTFTNMCLYVCVFFINIHLSVYSITLRPSPRVYIITSFTCVHNNRHSRRRSGIKSGRYEVDTHRVGVKNSSEQGISVRIGARESSNSASEHNRSDDPLTLSVKRILACDCLDCLYYYFLYL